MARGLPAVWSSILSVPFVGYGLYLYAFDTGFPSEFGIPFLFFGLFIVLVGVYVHFIAAPDPPPMRVEETLVDTRHPSQRVAIVKIVVGVPFLGIALYLLFFTVVPYVYPTLAFLVGLYFFSSGLHIYWTNTLTTYYITSERIIKEYRFLSLIRQEIPFDKVRGIEQRKSIIQALVGLGNVRVASGESGTLSITMRNISSTTDFADEIRNLI